jgi:2-polyprenyl-3-methyl-5-hydroxy-6-metoxy-1,4-benzoquinol methylase
MDPIDPEKLNQFMGKVCADLGATMFAGLVLVGERLGLYRAMAGAGPLTPGELARRTGTNERLVREWLNANAASGYVEYEPATARYVLPPEQAAALADETSPAYATGAFQIMTSALASEPKVRAAFTSGGGVGWHEHHHGLFDGTERFFKAGYVGNLLTSWLPALDGVEQKLRAGARVADIGCGHGASTILMAKAYPRSRFLGVDFHDASIERARAAAAHAGVTERTTFEVAHAKQYTGSYDLIAFFDCLHDLGDPIGAARHARASLAPGGTLMLVEPNAGDKVEDNLNPVGRLFYSASTFICTPCSQSQEVGTALGAQAGEQRLRGILAEAGFTTIRRAASTPFNLVLEATL